MDKKWYEEMFEEEYDNSVTSFYGRKSRSRKNNVPIIMEPELDFDLPINTLFGPHMIIEKK